jgi:hypothetical protein
VSVYPWKFLGIKNKLPVRNVILICPSNIPIFLGQKLRVRSCLVNVEIIKHFYARSDRKINKTKKVMGMILLMMVKFEE